MEENKNTQVDAFLKRQIQELPLETPSKNFTSNIMNVLNDEKVYTTIQYKPLISKKIWFVAAAAIIAIFLIPFQKREGGLLEKVSIDLSFADKISFSGLLEGLTVSNTAFYGLLFFAIMVFIQVVYLKGQFDKKMATGL
jgi:hypothetical protein